MQKIRRLLAIGVASAMVVCTVPVQAAESAANTAQATTNPAQSATNTPQDTSGTTQPQQPSATVKKIGLVKEGTKYVYYDKKGRKVKNKWLTIKKKRYYFKADGTAAIGGNKIGKYIYVFDLQGRLIKPSKSKIVTVGKTSYYVNKKGQAYKGFFKIGKRLYRGDSKGRLTKNKTVSNITFNSKGYANNDINAKLKMKLMSIMSKITIQGMSKSKKLYACWRYLTSGGRFYYSTYWPDFDQEGWQQALAYRMLTKGCGDCYAFACTFAAMAKELGYKPYVILGRVPGTRDGAADGMTSHGWVMIGGRYYDPEAEFAGWYRGVYGNSSYDIRHTVSRRVKF